MRGIRQEDVPDPTKPHPRLEAGEYRRVNYGESGPGGWQWEARPPRGPAGLLSDHTVEEHEDGTITAAPSIQRDGWHGYLERGEWRTV